MLGYVGMLKCMKWYVLCWTLLQNSLAPYDGTEVDSIYWICYRQGLA